MGDDGAQQRVLDRSRGLIQFVFRIDRNIGSAVDPIPGRERTALNVGPGFIAAPGVADAVRVATNFDRWLARVAFVESALPHAIARSKLRLMRRSTLHK